jgi:hypothetical protein
VAEGVGFEPTIRFPAYTLSKRAPSATRPPLLERHEDAAGAPSWRDGGKLTRPRVDRKTAPLRSHTDELVRGRLEIGFGWQACYTLSMKIGMITGFALLICAFVAAAAEMAAQARMGSFGFISAYNTVYALYPGKLILAEIMVEKYAHPLVWDIMVRTILVLPGWMILGVPGALIAWRSRPDYGKVYDDEDDDRMPYTSYEDIIAAAEEIEIDDIADSGSKYTEYEDYDPAGVTAIDSLDGYMDEWDPARPEDDPGFLAPMSALPPPDKSDG